MWRRNTIRFQRAARRVLHRVGSPQRAGRGLAAACFAAMIPVPGLRIVFSLLIAWAVRGSKFIAFTSQFVVLLIGTVPLTVAQFWIGRHFYRGTVASSSSALRLVAEMQRDWHWFHPIDSLVAIGASCKSAGPETVAPLVVGMLILGIVAATAAYPLGVISAVWFYLRRLRRIDHNGIRRPRGMLVLPGPTSFDENLTEAQALRRYALRPKTYVRADAVTLLIDGSQAYPEMLRSIAQAKESVALETYILQADDTGKSFAHALASAARRGVDTRLLYDCVGALGLPFSYVQELLEAGVKVGAYKPLSSIFKRSFMALQRRDHRKILVIDDSVSFTGGLNICHDNAPKCDGGLGWRDMHVRVDGAVPAQRLKAIVGETWKDADIFPPSAKVAPHPGTPAIIHSAPLPPTSTHALVQVIGNKEFLQRVRLRRAYLHAIRNARRYILIENAYFVPDRGIRRALYRAVKRGVTVAAGVAMYSDVKIVAMASRSLYSEMLSNGVRLFEYPLSMLHSKVAVIDDIWSIVSSYNLDHRSLLHNLEAGVLILDRPFAEAVRDQILTDIQSSREVTTDFHEARPWDEVLMESLAYQVRYWL
jgi:cardiolipin synthase